MESASVLEYKVDKNQVPPIDQKRIVAFINHFVINTVEFLNKFAVTCETKFIDFESKLLKVEASLAILEAKLASIPDLDNDVVATNNNNPIVATPSKVNVETPSTDTVDQPSSAPVSVDNKPIDPEPTITIPATGIKASEDIRYKKYFKMLQFGVPAPAVKLKMVADGLDARLLDNPNDIIEDGIREQVEDDD